MIGIWGSLSAQGITIVDLNDPNFYSDQGDIVDFIPGLAPRPEKVLALTMEYGTMGVDILNQLKTASRIVLENQAHFNGCASESVCKEVRLDFAELFNPTDPKWQEKVLAEADLAFSLLRAKF